MHQLSTGMVIVTSFLAFERTQKRYQNDTSGSYCFAPAPGTMARPAVSRPPDLVSASTGPIFTKVRRQWNIEGLATELVMLNGNGQNDSRAEVLGFSVSNLKPAPASSDIVVRFSTDVKDPDKAVTVDSGLWRVRRAFTPLEADEVGGNYRPALTEAMISDDKLQLYLATERTTGVASLAQGQLEAKLLRDQVGDSCDLGPPDRDRSLLTQSLQLVLGRTGGDDNARRQAIAAATSLDPLRSYLVHSTRKNKNGSSMAWLRNGALPPGVRLQSVRTMASWPEIRNKPQTRKGKSKAGRTPGAVVLIRLVYSATHPGLLPVTLDLSTLFTGGNLTGIVETVLSGNAELPGSHPPSIVQIIPGTIRTFVGALLHYK